MARIPMTQRCGSIFTRLPAGTLAVFAVIWISTAAAWGDAAEDLRQFTGAPARLTWVQQTEGDGDDPFCWGNQLAILALDTEENDGPRVLVPAPGNVHRPMITPDGQHVVYSSLQTREAFVVAWTGGPPRKLGDGYAAATWRDPATGTIWIYLADNGRDGWERHHAATLDRVRLDDPTVRESVWDRARFTIDNLQLSADGTRFCAQFPHPRAGIANIPARSWLPLGRGCWTSIAPDNSYLVWIFDGPHRNVIIHDPLAETSWRVPLNTAPGMDGFEVYHPRWSNHRRFFTLTGPYTKGRPGENLIAAGGPDVNVWIGRFSEDLKTVESWLQITCDPHGHFYPDLWIEPQTAAVDGAVAVRESPVDAGEQTDGRLMLWENVNAPNDAGGRRWNAEPRGRAFWGPAGDMWLDGGSFLLQPDGPPATNENPSESAVTLEISLVPRDRCTTSVATIAAPAVHGAPASWALEQRGDTIWFWGARSGQTNRHDIQMGLAESGLFIHLAIVFSGDSVKAWRNGILLPSSPPDSLSAGIAPGPLWLGAAGQPVPDCPWKGRILSLALYNRALSDEEIHSLQATQARRFNEQAAPPEYQVIARLKEAHPPPSPASILPYRRALLAQPFSIIQAPPDSGLAPGDTIAVAHWTILDGQSTRRSFTPEKQYRLHLTLFADWPLLESERLFLPPALLRFPLYYECAVRESDPPPPPPPSP